MKIVGVLIVVAVILSIYSLIAVTIMSSTARTNRAFHQAHRAAVESGLNPFWQIGAGRVGLMHASFPLAQILVTTSQIDLLLFGQRYTIDRSAVTEISRTLTGGIRIKHTDIGAPAGVVFSSFQCAELVAALADRGYPLNLTS